MRVLPAVYVDDELLADARELRARLGDEQFIAELPAGDDEWGDTGLGPGAAGRRVRRAAGRPGAATARR